MMNQVTVQPNNNQVTNEQAQNSSNIINNNESIEPSNNTVQEINMTSISQNESSIEQTANNQINTTTDNKNDNNQVFQKNTNLIIEVVNKKQTQKNINLKPSWVLYSTGFLYCKA